MNLQSIENLRNMPATDSELSIRQLLHSIVRISSTHNNQPSEDWVARAVIHETPSAMPYLPERIVSPNNSKDPLQEQVWSILSHPRFARLPQEMSDGSRSMLYESVCGRVNSRQPLEIVLPSIPFKDQNPITTGQSIDAIDLGEHAMIAQLRDIIVSVQQIYPAGITIRLVADGLIYRQYFTNSDEAGVIRYREGVEGVIERYGINNFISVTDFSDLIAHDPQFFTHQRDVGLVLNTISEGTDLHLMQVMQRGMLANTVSNTSISTMEQYIRSEIETWPEELAKRTRRTAYEYAAFLITAAQRGIINRHFPDAIRATVHPKNAPQLPLHVTNHRNRILPYNGVPVVNTNALEPRNIRIERLATVLGRPEHVIRHVDPNGMTLYYSRGERL